MSKKQPLINAGKIIERFGGIRPMASKIDTPVTTVQGWKKRDVIPGSRREQIVSAASEHNIDISDLANASSFDESSSTKSSKPKVKKTNPTKPKSVQPKTNKAVTDVKVKAANINQDTSSSSIASVPASKGSVPREKAIPSNVEKTANRFEKMHDENEHDRLIAEIEKNNRKAVTSSTWITTGLILLALAAGTFLFWPSVKENQDQLNAQNEQLVALENKVKDNKKIDLSDDVISDELQNKIDGL